jgi:hypothetical protein
MEIQHLGFQLELIILKIEPQRNIEKGSCCLCHAQCERIVAQILAFSLIYACVESRCKNVIAKLVAKLKVLFLRFQL